MKDESSAGHKIANDIDQKLFLKIIEEANRIHKETRDIKVWYLPISFINIVINLDIPKCECGAEVCNTPHVDWCPKYEK